MKKEEENQNKIHWYALYTRSRAEKKILEQFQSKGITAFLPIKKELRQWSDRKKWVEVPAINSYIFAQFQEDQIKRAYEIPGIVAFVNDKGKPAIIPDSQMQLMQKAVENKINFTIEQNTFKKGDWVKITSGPLIGIEGQIADIRGKNQFCVEMESIGFMMIIDAENATFEKYMPDIK